MFHSQLALDTTFLFGHDQQNLQITPTTQEKTKQQIEAAVARVEERLSQGKYDFITTLSQQRYVTQTEQVFAQLAWAKTMVVVGIGGSDLGARAIQQALEGENPPMQVLFLGDSTDPEAITRLFRRIDLTKTVFVIISKSGQTVETISHYIFLKNYLVERKEEWQQHFVFITDESAGILRPEAEQHGILTLPIPAGVGGRFSVLTPVGLLPARAMGVPLQSLLDAAVLAAASVEFRQLAQEIAATMYQLYVQGIKLCVMMPYSIQLTEFARWFRQLWAESLGKDGKGIMPIQAFGPADQHSQQQFYNQGEPLQSVWFVRVEKRASDYTIDTVSIEEVAYLQGHSFHELINVEQETAALALKKVGRPAAVLSVASISSQSLGELFVLFELAVVYLAEMMAVDAFDQPGVEEGKQMMYALLGKPGFEDKRQEIEKLRSSNV